MFHGVTAKLDSIFSKQDIFLASEPIQSKFFIDKILKFKKVMLITGKHSYTASGANLFVKEFFKNIETNIFNEFDVNPDIDQISPGYEIAKEIQPDAIIAIGGGSVLDTAKIIHLMYCNDLNKDKIFSFKRDYFQPPIKNLPLIAIPTTAGTGSESTHFAVVYKNKKKFSISSKTMLPGIVFLDHNFCLSNSSYQNACSGFDALSQAIESYWSKKSSLISRIYSLKAIELILKNFKSVVNDPYKDHLALMNMLIAANYAGKAINLTKTTAPHALSYGITQRLGLPHGHAVALTIGAFFEMHDLELRKNNSITMKELKQFRNINNFFLKKLNFPPHIFFYKLMDSFSMDYDTELLGLDKKTVMDIIENVNLERLSNHPIKLSKDCLKNVFNLIPKKT